MTGIRGIVRFDVQSLAIREFELTLNEQVADGSFGGGCFEESLEVVTISGRRDLIDSESHRLLHRVPE